MPDEIQTPRKRGRPPKAPGESVKRPNVSLRLKQELYDHVVQQARENGRSLSEEMEKRVEEAFLLQGIQKNVSSIVERAVAEAIEATAKRENEDNLEFFGGEDGFVWAKSSADAYTAVFLELVEKMDVKDEKDITEDFRKELVARMKEKQDEISELWFARVQFAVLIPHVAKFFKDQNFKSLAENTPELRDFIERTAKRRGIPSELKPK